MRESTSSTVSSARSNPAWANSSALVLETAGLAQNGYQQFVSEFSKKVPIITKKGYIGEDGNFYKTGDKTSPYYEWIHNYDIIQYNNIFDTKNRVQDLYKIAQ